MSSKAKAKRKKRAKSIEMNAIVVPTSLESRGCSRWHLEQNEALKQISGSLFHPYSSGDSSLVANRCVPVLPMPTL
ncbi:hypothetical protein TNCV_3368091 [Trichonephila clavipes]|nr:hypothetical protein TNCV_3368091 [Trichonephila clavipes]